MSLAALILFLGVLGKGGPDFAFAADSKAVEMVSEGALVKFEDWKKEHIEKAERQQQALEAQLKELQVQEFVEGKQRGRERNKILTEIEEAKEQARLSRGLTVQDYFLNHLGAHPDRKEALRFATETLDKEQITKILEAYAEVVQQRQKRIGSLQFSAPGRGLRDLEGLGSGPSKSQKPSL